jgi:hypothetical protein
MTSLTLCFRAIVRAASVNPAREDGRRNRPALGLLRQVPAAVKLARDQLGNLATGPITEFWLS